MLPLLPPHQRTVPQLLISAADPPHHPIMGGDHRLQELGITADILQQG